MAETGRRGGGPIAEELAATGDVLFRWRSYMPLLLVPLFVVSVRPNRPPTPFAIEIIAFGIALSGLLVRALVVGAAPAGTSTRGTKRPTAARLVTSGAYSLVRHPLYVANTLIWIGCALLSGTWYLPVIVALLSFIYHERIAAREEAFLLASFGDQFRAWARDVPAFLPRWDGYKPAAVGFQLRKVIVQESHGLCAIGTSFFVLDTIEDSIRLGHLYFDRVWLAVFAATAILFLIAIAIKKSTKHT